MKPWQRPHWLILVLTLPQAMLFAVFRRIHGVIGTLLAIEATAAWTGFGLSLAALWSGFTAYALWALIRRRLLGRPAFRPRLLNLSSTHHDDPDHPQHRRSALRGGPLTAGTRRMAAPSKE